MSRKQSFRYGRRIDGNNRAIDKHFNSPFDRFKRQKEPFPGPDWLSKSVTNLDVEAGLDKKAVYQILKSHRVHVVDLKHLHWMCRSKKKSWIVLRSCYAGLCRARSESDFEGVATKLLNLRTMR